MRIAPSTTLQISLAPSDYRLAEILLPHQIRTWQGQVSEVLLTIDTRRSRGRFGEEWEAGRARIFALAEKTPGARVVEVDYSTGAQAAVSAQFFNGAAIPEKDCRGGPYYAYFFGLYSAQHDWVLHSDADIFFGGGSAHWLGQAIDYYQQNPEVLFLAPHPGPPSPRGTLRQLRGEPITVEGSRGFRFREMSTRCFLFNRERFRCSLGALRPRRPAIRACLLAFLEGNPGQELPEQLITDQMDQKRLCRIDFLGTGRGCWSLHPPYRCADFYDKLPSLVTRVESGELPERQCGDHDINDSLVDWSEARARMARRRWWRRLAERVTGKT